ncbi:glycosyltransferase [Candidatus Neomarinimicrobiota bacterium]
MILSVVVVSYNVKEFVSQCLQSVQASSFDGVIELILIDNHSHDGTPDMVRELYPQVKMIVNDQNLGFASALNQGLNISTGDYMLSLNPDTIVEEMTLQKLVDYLAANPEAGIVGPKILNSDGSFQRAAKRSFPTLWGAFTHFSGLSRLFPGSRLFGQYNLTHLDPDQSHIVEAVSGSCMCLTRQVYQEIGGMDEDFFLGADDLDYCYRAVEAGYSVHYLAETQIVHYKGVSRALAPFYNLRLHFEAMYLFARKHRKLAGGLPGQIMIKAGIWIIALITYLKNYLNSFSSLVIDSLFIAGAFGLIILVRFLPDPMFRTKYMLINYAPVVGVYLILWLLVGAVFRIYGRYVLSYSRAIVSSIIGFVLLATGTYVYRDIAYSRIVLVAASILVAITLPGWRMLVSYWQIAHRLGDSHRTKRPSIFSRRVAVHGIGEEGIRVARLLLNRPDLGLDMIGFIAHDVPYDKQPELPLPLLGTSSDLGSIAERHRLKELIIADGQVDNSRMMTLLEQTRSSNLLFRIVPHAEDIMLGQSKVEHFGQIPFVEMEATLYQRFHLFAKRTFDLLLSGSIALILLPLWPIILIGGGVQRELLWKQDGKLFHGLTLRRGSAAFRKLPLVWSILRGHMSFVGGALISADDTDPGLLFKPGLTGMSQMRKAVADSPAADSYQHYYLQHQSLTMDLEIILKSILGF